MNYPRPETQLDRDLEDIELGKAAPRPPIAIHRDEEFELPDPDVLAHTQHLAAIERLRVRTATLTT